jgi:isochorismate hydrolase
MIAASLLLPGLTGCVNQSPIDQVVITGGVTSTGQPELAVDNFTPDVNNIYCSVKLSNVSASSTVKAEWYVAKSEEAGLTDSLIGNETLPASSP